MCPSTTTVRCSSIWTWGATPRCSTPTRPPCGAWASFWWPPPTARRPRPPTPLGGPDMLRPRAISPAELAALCIDMVPVRVLGGREGCRVVVSTPSGPWDLSVTGERLLFADLQRAAEVLAACGVRRFAVDLNGALE